MKKKLLSILLVTTMAVSMVACSSSENTNNPESNQSNETVENEETTKAERDLPEGSYSDTGNGTFSIQTAGGDSAEGIIPKLFVEGEDSLIQIGYFAEGMDGSHLSYIYIDGMENTKEQLGEMVQGSLDLQDDMLKSGIHTVEVVQYDTDEPSGNIITYKSCQYEVAEK